MPSVCRLDHINMMVKNLEESRKFYDDLFGLKLKKEGESRGRKYMIIGAPGSFYLCMYETLTGEPNGLNHFGLHVGDLKNWESRLKELNVKILYDGVVEFEASSSLYIVDPNGYEVELSEKFGGDLN